MVGFLHGRMVIHRSSSLPAVLSYNEIHGRRPPRTERTNATMSAVFKRDLWGSQHSGRMAALRRLVVVDSRSGPPCAPFVPPAQRSRIR